MTLVRSQPIERLIRGLLERDFLNNSTIEFHKNTEFKYSSLRLYEIEGFVELASSEILERTISFLASSSHQVSPIVYWLKCNGKQFKFYYGYIPMEIQTRPNQWLEHSLKAFFPGSKIKVINDFDQRSLRLDLEQREHCSAICGLPSERVHTEIETRLDEALDGISTIPFDLMLIAEPIGANEFNTNHMNLLQLAKTVSTLANTTVTEHEQEQFIASMNETLAQQEEVKNRFHRSVDAHHQKTWQDQTRRDKDFEKNRDEAIGLSLLGAFIGGAIGFLAGGVGAAPGAAIGAELGGQVAKATQDGVTRTGSNESRVQAQHNAGRSEEINQTQQERKEYAEQQRKILSQEITRTNINREAQLLEELLNKHLDRWKTGKGVGMWKTSVHVFTNSESHNQSVCDVLSGALRGDHTHLEPLKWIKYKEVSEVAHALMHLQVPHINSESHPLFNEGEQLKTHLNTYELAHWLRPPARELAGFQVRPSLNFGRTPPASQQDALNIGQLIYRGSLLPKEQIQIGTQDLTSHALLVGTTGAGKTTTARKLLWELQNQDRPIPFMVIEPAKSEYDDLFEALKRAGKNPIRLFAGRDGDDGLHINPLKAPYGLPLGRHVDWIKTILLSCFSMQESLPQILERVLLSTYEQAGLSKFHQVYTEQDPNCPVLADFDQMIEVDGKTVSHIEHVIETMGYGRTVKPNLLAAMRVRLLSLVSGVKSVIFQQETYDWEDLLNRPVFIQLSDVVEPDVRRLIMGSLIGRVYGLREAAARQGRLKKHQGLRHLLLLEEAHHLIKKADANQSLSLLINQVISDAFAELRAYGQGILVADQSPSLLDTSVIRNTNVKLVHRLLFAEDCTSVGDSIGLNDEEKQALRYLQTGECLLFKSGLNKALHLKVQAWET